MPTGVQNRCSLHTHAGEKRPLPLTCSASADSEASCSSRRGEGALCNFSKARLPLPQSSTLFTGGFVGRTDGRTGGGAAGEAEGRTDGRTFRADLKSPSRSVVEERVSVSLVRLLFCLSLRFPGAPGGAERRTGKR